MIRILLSLLLTVGLTGCASISHPLPKCDGYSRRPLNRSMWQWESNGKTDQATTGAIPADPASRAASFAEEPASVTPVAFAHFDIAGSYRPCEGK
jgi:type IV secretion system protein VirB7